MSPNKGNHGTLEAQRAITFLRDPKTTPAILSTVISRINRFAPIAAAWSAAPKRISLKEWVQEGNSSVLVLPRDYSCKDPLDALNRVLFTRATQLLLSQPDVPDDQVKTFIYVDEARNLGPLDLTPILVEGRSRGQNPLRDFAIFLVLLHTGLRVSELLGLDIDQYQGKHLRNVKRKGKKVSRQVFLTKEARDALDDYVENVRGKEAGPIFQSRRRQRLARQNVDDLLKT